MAGGGETAADISPHRTGADHGDPWTHPLLPSALRTNVGHGGPAGKFSGSGWPDCEAAVSMIESSGRRCRIATTV